MVKRTEVAALIADEQTDASLKRQLQTVLDIRAFASNELALPDNHSYRSYVDVGGSYVLWNVVATGEFSLSAKTWCYPFAGCVAYRGYYAETDARAFADSLEDQGLDVFVGGVAGLLDLGLVRRSGPEHDAGSTVHLSCRGYLSRARSSAGLHQRRHHLQRVFCGRGWSARGCVAGFIDTMTPRDSSAIARSWSASVGFIELVLETRERLAALYVRGLTEQEKRTHKSEIFAALRARYAERSDWFGEGFGQWLEDDLNNAKLALIATYHAQISCVRAAFANVRR